jgi:hypothetical protein
MFEPGLAMFFGLVEGNRRISTLPPCNLSIPSPHEAGRGPGRGVRSIKKWQGQDAPKEIQGTAFARSWTQMGKGRIRELNCREKAQKSQNRKSKSGFIFALFAPSRGSFFASISELECNFRQGNGNCW